MSEGGIVTEWNRRGYLFWWVQIPGWLLLIYLVFAQGITAFSYDLGVAIGTQEPASRITDVGVAFWYGFALGDLLIYIPLLCAGLIGHARGARWGQLLLAAAMGITAYWPVVCLAALVKACGASGWNISSEIQYWIVCVTVFVWGIFGLSVIVKDVVKQEKVRE